jgi:hypothetical protein
MNAEINALLVSGVQIALILATVKTKPNATHLMARVIARTVSLV